MLQLTTIFFLISFSLLAALHYLSIKLFLYWQFTWIDMPMHFFGGAVVALGIFTLADLKLLPRRWLTLIPVASGVLFVALVWEAFEFTFQVIDMQDYYFDTAIDLVLGVLGAGLGYFVGKQLHTL